MSYWSGITVERIGRDVILTQEGEHDLCSEPRLVAAVTDQAPVRERCTVIGGYARCNAAAVAVVAVGSRGG